MTRTRRARAALAAAVIAATLAGCAPRHTPPTAPPPVTTPAATTTAPGPTPPAATPTPTRAGDGATPAATPVRLTLSWAHTTARVVPVANRPNGTLEIPHDVRVAGWWSPGARPGDPTGTTVFVGHVDDREQGLGAFYALWRARPGDHAQTQDADGTRQRWTVTSTRTYPKTAVPFDALFTTTGPRRLALITCDGDFHNGHYTNNRVVLATPDP